MDQGVDDRTDERMYDVKREDKMYLIGYWPVMN